MSRVIVREAAKQPVITAVIMTRATQDVTLIATPETAIRAGPITATLATQITARGGDLAQAIAGIAIITVAVSASAFCLEMTVIVVTAGARAHIISTAHPTARSIHMPIRPIVSAC